MKSSVALLAALHVSCHVPLAAQHLPPTTPPFEVAWPLGPGGPTAHPLTHQAQPLTSNLLPKAPDYRWEGIVVGGVVLGVGSAVLFHGFCDDGQGRASCALRAIEGALIGAVVGAGVGGLIGGLIPKKNP